MKPKRVWCQTEDKVLRYSDDKDTSKTKEGQWNSTGVIQNKFIRCKVCNRRLKTFIKYPGGFTKNGVPWANESAVYLPKHKGKYK